MLRTGIRFEGFISAMEEGTKSEDHLISTAAFVEGGTQDACDDACSICLEAFSESDPLTVTSCKHEFHLQCILEWCQRSSQCPMCWQSISLKDPSSQELLDGIEQERSITANNASMNATIFHHPTFGDFELQHLPVNATDAELEERIIQHLAAAAAMGRARHMARREGQRSRTSAQGRFRYSGFSAQPSVPFPTRPTSSDDVEPTSAIGGAHLVTVHEEPVRETEPSSSSVVPARPYENQSTERSVIHSSPNNQDIPGPSEQHSFSDFKTRVNAISTRYKESITKTTKSWKERLFSRNTDHGSKDASITTLSRMMESLQQDTSPVSNTSSPSNLHENYISRNEIMGLRPAPPPDSGIE